jgi:hypothetical protein
VRQAEQCNPQILVLATRVMSALMIDLAMLASPAARTLRGMLSVDGAHVAVSRWHQAQRLTSSLASVDQQFDER